MQTTDFMNRNYSQLEKKAMVYAVNSIKRWKKVSQNRYYTPCRMDAICLSRVVTAESKPGIVVQYEL